MFPIAAEPSKPISSHYEQVVEIDKRAEAPRIKHEAYHLMRQLEGWCAESKAGILIDLILKTRPDVILEIGVWGGKSLVPMAYALKENQKGVIYGIDPWDNHASIEGATNDNKAFWGTVDHTAVMKALINRINQFGLNDRIRLIRSTSEEAPPIENIDILHIDGNHSDKTSFLDVTKWVPYVNKGGWIIFDDMTWFEGDVYTTARATKWLDEHCIRIGQFKDSCEWGLWRKP